MALHPYEWRLSGWKSSLCSKCNALSIYASLWFHSVIMSQCLVSSTPHRYLKSIKYEPSVTLVGMYGTYTYQHSAIHCTMNEGRIKEKKPKAAKEIQQISQAFQTILEWVPWAKGPG